MVGLDSFKVESNNEKEEYAINNQSIGLKEVSKGLFPFSNIKSFKKKF
jgi:hypothetical protein